MPETILHLAPGVRLMSRPRADCANSYYTLAIGDRHHYVGRDLVRARDQLPLLIDAGLQADARVELPDDTEVLELAKAAARASDILALSRSVLRERGLGPTDVLVLPGPIVDRLVSGEETLVAALAVLGHEQRALVEQVRELFADFEHEEALAGALRLRRHIAASPTSAIDPLTHFVDTRMRAFAAAASTRLLERLTTFDVDDFAKQLREHERGSIGDRGAVHREVSLRGPLVLAFNSAAPACQTARLDRGAGAALLVTNEQLAMTGRELETVPFQVVRPLVEP